MRLGTAATATTPGSGAACSAAWASRSPHNQKGIRGPPPRVARTPPVARASRPRWRASLYGPCRPPYNTRTTSPVWSSIAAPVKSGDFLDSPPYGPKGRSASPPGDKQQPDVSVVSGRDLRDDVEDPGLVAEACAVRRNLLRALRRNHRPACVLRKRAHIQPEAFKLRFGQRDRRCSDTITQVHRQLRALSEPEESTLDALQRAAVR